MDVLASDKNIFYIDVGNQLVKIGFLKESKWYIKKIKTSNLSSSLVDKVFDGIKIDYVYIGSVVKKATDFFKNYFELRKIDFKFITNDMFDQKINLNPLINLYEVGVDILAFCYLVRNFANTLCLNFGTATVAFNYDNCLNGVMIGPNLVHSYDYLQDILNQTFELSYINSFGTDTFQSINANRTFMINGFINEILSKYNNINTIIYTGGDRKFLSLYKNSKNLEILEVEEAVIKGYYALINEK